jgi:23S rRNA pseudouridine1911/1915/1917 synthase
MPENHQVLVQRRGRLDKLLTAELPQLSRARIQALIAQGHVTIGGEPRKASFKPVVGDVVHVRVPDVAETELSPQDLGIEILFQDADLVVVNKPAGMVVHPSKGHPDRTLVNALLFAVGDLAGIGGEHRPGIVHRLDKGTSGVMVVAKNDQAHRGLKDQFSAHSIERRYRCLVLGGPDLDGGRIESELGRDPRDRLRQASVEEGEGRYARTDWFLVERLHRSTLIECQLHTGRTHQVRVHLSEQGWPILGDPVYRDRQTAPRALRELLEGVDHQLLHARVLGFEHPTTGQPLRFVQEPPADFLRVLQGLRALGR